VKGARQSAVTLRTQAPQSDSKATPQFSNGGLAVCRTGRSPGEERLNIFFLMPLLFGEAESGCQQDGNDA
jgi:hypothetical protein